MAKKPQPRPEELTPRKEGGRPPALTAVKFELICEELARTGSKYRACEALAFNYTTVMEAIAAAEGRGDDSWREAWNEAYDKFRDSLEQAAIARARDGTPTEWRLGRNPDGSSVLIPTKVEYSDRLAEVLLKGHFPERFRDRVHHSGLVGLQPVDAFANLSLGAKREIRAIIMRDLEEQRAAEAHRLQVHEAEGQLIEGEAIVTAIEDMREAGADGDK